MLLNRDIDTIIVHCSASSPKTTIKDITKWHKDKGWKTIGYHYVIEWDGRIGIGRSIDEVGAHCEGHNEHSIGICLVGGKDSTGKNWGFNPVQFKELQILIDGLLSSFPYIRHIQGHNFYNKYKECPCFDIRKKCKIPEGME